MKLGFIGGGLNSAVGYTHFLAARLDGIFEIVAGCFSRQNSVNADTASRFGVDESRCYACVDDLLLGEQGRLDAICILTPTPIHAKAVVAALKAGFNVICEKALATSLSELELINRALIDTGKKLFVTFNYVGYPMVREAKAIIDGGSLGRVQQIYCEMPQESFSRAEANPQDWRKRDYEIPCVSLDLGVHVHQMTHYLLGGCKCEMFTAWEASFGRIPGFIDTVSLTRTIQSQTLVNMMWGKAALGHTNGLRFRIFAERGSLEWSQSQPELLFICDDSGQRKTLERGQPELQRANEPRYNRFKAGHPAGFVEAFANIYSDFHDGLMGTDTTETVMLGPDVAAEGLTFLSEVHQKASRCQ